MGLSSRPARQLSEQVPPRRSRSSMALFDPKLPSTARNEAHFHGQAKHSLAKVSGAATKRIVPSWSHCCKIACVLQLRSREGLP